MVGLTWFHAVVIILVGPIFAYFGEISPNALLAKASVFHTLPGGLVVSAFALAACSRRLSRTWRATAVGMGLMSASAILVYLSGGYIELHFHFFVMLTFMAIYQDWVPYVVAILYVALQHGVMGVLWPHEVFNHPAAFNAPWKWAAIHAFFVLCASVGSIISWKYTERAFGQARLVLESAGEGIFGLDQDGRVTFINSAAIIMLGLEHRTTVGTRIISLVHHTKADSSPYLPHESPLLMPLRTGASYHATDTVFRRHDGTSMVVEYRSTPITESGEVIGIVVTFNDATERKQAEAELKATLSLFSATVESTADGILVVNQAGKIIHFNRKFVAMWRIPEQIMASRSDEQALGWVLDQLRDREGFLKKVQELYATPEAESHDVLTVKDGRIFERYSQPQRVDGNSVGRVWSFRDVTAKVHAEEEVHLLHTLTRLISEADDLQRALQSVLQTIGEATEWTLGQAWIPRADGMLECSPAVYRQSALGDILRSASETITFGANEGLPGRVWASKEPLWLRGESLPEMLPFGPLTQKAGFHAALGIPVLAGENVVAVLEFYLGDPRQEDTRWMDVVVNAALHIGDLIQRKRAEADLAKQATHDALTDLYNRRSLEDRTAQELARAERYGDSLAVLLADLDHFKAINDTYGHHRGDLVLKAVAQSILDSSRGSDLVFRWGGDEFVILLTQATRDGTRAAANRIRDAVHAVANELHLAFDLSIGIAIYPEHGRTMEELIRLADRALYLAKKSGDPVKIGEEDYQLTGHALTVVFQPVMNIRTNQVIGYEALTRDAAGKLSVMELFAKYERIGKLHELKCLCFTRQLHKASEVGLFRVFVNVDFGVLRHLVPPPKPPTTEVILEISELEALDNVDERIEIATAWRARGYKFAIDDFGAGFISLPFIARLIPEYIKIDRSTLLQAVSSPQFQEFMVGLVFALSNYSTEGIIIEGVETEQELQIAKATGVFLIQGYLFGKPREWDGVMLQQRISAEDKPPQAA
jgi:diguanylate cyclase (GGDEF)-like protein/PAS domain S-box-containing protein